MFLGKLIDGIDVLKVDGSGTIDIKGIAYDSRTVEPGFLFVAVPGFKTDGHNYVRQAVEAGAPAVMVEREVDLPAGIARVLVKNTRQALARVASVFYNHPSEELRMIGVTGTNGKTTTTYLISSIYREAGEKVGVIGTIANYIGDRKLDVSHTTPESADLQKLLREMRNEGVAVAVAEVSSHALALERVTGCRFDVGVFTNLTQDHLDFHHSMDDYLQAKARLLTGISPGSDKGPRYVVVNLDDPYAARITRDVRVPVVTYGLSPEADIRAADIKVTDQGNSFTVESRFGVVHLNMKLTGLFNVYNTLAAFAVGVAGGLNPALAARALEKVRGVPGRFQLVECGQDFAVVVDYAHSPDGLENILKTARTLTGGRLITVFGCGGDRDRTKRPIMGEIAGRYSDLPIITSDNPRTEDPLTIIGDVEEGIKRVMNPGQYMVIPDRREAIRTAVAGARKGDLVMIAGKGHEDYQIIGTQKFHFDDREEAVRAIQDLLK